MSHDNLPVAPQDTSIAPQTKVGIVQKWRRFLLSLKGKRAMIWTAAGALISYSSTFFNWGRKALEALQGYDYLVTPDSKSASLLYWLFSPRGAQLFTVLFLAAFFIAVIRTVSSAQKLVVEGTAGDGELQKDENRHLAPSEPEPNIVCVAAKTDWVGMDVNYTFVERLSNEGGISYVATFANEPDDKHPEIGSIKKVVARIVFNRLDGSLVHRVHTGTWLEEDFNFTDFGKGSIRKLLIGKVVGEGFRTFNDNRESENRYLPPSDEHLVGNTELKVHVHLFSLEDSKFSVDTTLDLLSGKSYGIAIADPASPTTTKFSNMPPPKFRFKGGDTQLDAENARAAEGLNNSIKELEQKNTELENAGKAAAKTIEQQRTQIGRLQHQTETQSIQIKFRDQEAEQWKDIHDKARACKKEIEWYVRVTSCSINYQYIDQIDPYIIFTISIFNAAVYDISFDSKVEGHLSFDNQKLSGTKEITSPLKVFSYGSNSYIRVSHHLTDSAAAAIKKAKEAQRGLFNLKNLVIKFYGYGIEPTELKLPEGVWTTGILYP